MLAELSNTTLSNNMSPTFSVLELKASSQNSPVHVMDFNSSDKRNTSMVVIPKCLVPSLCDESLASALAKGAALTNHRNTTENTIFSPTEDSSVSTISTEEPSSPTRRRAIFSPYWKKSGEQPLELVPTGALEEEVAAIRCSAAAVQSWHGSYEFEIQQLQAPLNKPRLVKSDTVLVRPMPPSILRKPKYSRGGNKPRRNTSPDLSATSLAIAGALATIEADLIPSLPSSNRVQFNAKVDVRLFSKERPMLEDAEPGWSKQFAY